MKKLNQKGFTLIELAIILTIVGLVIGGIWIAASTVMNNMKKKDLGEGTIQLVQNLRNLYTGQASATGLSNTSADAAGAFPASWRRTTTGGALQSVQHPVTPRSIGATTNTVTVTTSGANMSINYSNLPRDACIELVSGRLAASQAIAQKTGLVSVDGLTTFPITPASAAGICEDSGTTHVSTITMLFAPQ
jgi:type II secretory pathway pseudopilin PulG